LYGGLEQFSPPFREDDEANLGHRRNGLEGKEKHTSKELKGRDGTDGKQRMKKSALSTKKRIEKMLLGEPQGFSHREEGNVGEYGGGW